MSSFLKEPINLGEHCLASVTQNFGSQKPHIFKWKKSHLFSIIRKFAKKYVLPSFEEFGMRSSGCIAMLHIVLDTLNVCVFKSGF